MNGIQEIIGSVFILIGVLFSLLGVVGVLRLPDTYSRLHASGKTANIGIIFMGIGVAVIRPEWSLKVVALSIFLVFSSPVASHAIASSVHRSERFRRDEEEAMKGDAHQDIADIDKGNNDQQAAPGTSPA